MKRRVLLAGIGAAAIAPLLPCPATAQSPSRVPRVGLIGNAPLRPIEALRGRLRELGYIEGQNLVIEARFSNGRDDRFPGFVAELAAVPVDMIIAWGTPAALAAKSAASRIPVVFVAGDAVNTGIVSSLSRPEANITGFIAINAQLEEKRIELIKEIVPGAARVAVLSNALNPLNRLNIDTARRVGGALAMSVEAFDIRNAQEIEAALRRLTESRPDAALIASDITLLSERRRIADTLNAHRIPAVYPFREYADVDAFVIYGANISVLFQNVAGYVDRILKGEAPESLPIQQATAFELIVNLKTAAKLGLSVSQLVLARADEVIE
jgi:putative ABC transport system substrate-binding protein